MLVFNPYMNVRNLNLNVVGYTLEIPLKIEVATICVFIVDDLVLIQEFLTKSLSGLLQISLDIFFDSSQFVILRHKVLDLPVGLIHGGHYQIELIKLHRDGLR